MLTLTETPVELTPAASTVLDEHGEHDRECRALHSCAEKARQEVRKVAAVFVENLGPAAVSFFRQLADNAAAKDDTAMVASFTEFAEAAEQLLAERGLLT